MLREVVVVILDHLGIKVLGSFLLLVRSLLVVFHYIYIMVITKSCMYVVVYSVCVFKTNMCGS